MRIDTSTPFAPRSTLPTSAPTSPVIKVARSHPLYTLTKIAVATLLCAGIGALTLVLGFFFRFCIDHWDAYGLFFVAMGVVILFWLGVILVLNTLLNSIAKAVKTALSGLRGDH